MNARQVEDLYREILTIWPNPAPKTDEQAQWGTVLVAEELPIAERTLTYLEQEMVQGNPRRFRPALTEWEHRYKLLDKARQSGGTIVPHECYGGMVMVSDADKGSTGGSWRPCEHCNPAGYERWRHGEYRVRIDKAEPAPPDPRIGHAWLDKIRADRGMPPIERATPVLPLSELVDVNESF